MWEVYTLTMHHVADYQPPGSQHYQLKCPQLTQNVQNRPYDTTYIGARNSSTSVNWSEHLNENVGIYPKSHLDLNKNTVCIRHAIKGVNSQLLTATPLWSIINDTQGRAYWDSYTHMTKCQTNFKIHIKQHITTQ